MASGHFKRIHLPCLEIEGRLGLADARSGFESHFEDYRSTVSDASVDSACTVLCRTAVRTYRVIMFRALQPRRHESITEFDAAHTRYGEYRMRDDRLHAVPERFSVTWIDASDTTLDHGTDAVTLLDGIVDDILPFLIPARDTAHFDNPRLHAIDRSLVQDGGVCKNHLCDRACRYDREGKTAREMAASARILTVVPFEGSGKVRMARTRHSCEQTVVRRVGVGVAEDYGQRRTCGVSFEDSAHDLRLVFLYARGCSSGSALASGDVRQEVLLRKFETCRNPVQHHSDEFAVGLTENAHSEFSA